MSRNQKIIFSFILLFIGLLIFASEYFNSKKIKVFDYMNEWYYSEEISVIEVEEITDEIMEQDNENNEEEKESDTSYNTYENKSVYIGYLIINIVKLILIVI